MDRKILFRGKVTELPLYLQDKKKVGTWVYGSYLSYPVAQIVDLEEEYVVDPTTVGQFTGLTDKNGVKIFEGDVIRCIANPEVNQFISSGTIEVMQCDYVVVYKEKSACGFYYLHHVLMDTVEVIGNIHDTPELETEEAE